MFVYYSPNPNMKYALFSVFDKDGQTVIVKRVEPGTAVHAYVRKSCLVTKLDIFLILGICNRSCIHAKHISHVVLNYTVRNPFGLRNNLAYAKSRPDELRIFKGSCRACSACFDCSLYVCLFRLSINLGIRLNFMHDIAASGGSSAYNNRRDHSN